LHNFTIFGLPFSYLSEKQHKRIHEFTPGLHGIPDIIALGPELGHLHASIVTLLADWLKSLIRFLKANP
jgi:hypothetical protein